MIVYTKHSFGLNVWWAIFTGSAWPKSMPAAIVSGLIYLLLEFELSKDQKEDMKIDHPYALGVLFSAVGFLIVFRANHAYGRLAAAADSMYEMESRSLDGIIQFASFHMQTEDFKTGSETSKKWLAQFYHLYSLVLALCCMALRKDQDLRNLAGYEHGKVPSSKVAWNSLNAFEGDERIYRPQSFLRRLHYAASMRSSPELNRVYHRHNQLEVYGGISAEECYALQAVSSPKVRAELAMMWLTAFLTAAEKAGELGLVPSAALIVCYAPLALTFAILLRPGCTPPPIVARSYSWLSDGMLGFSKALRVVEVPFPFIIAQIAELAVIALVPLVPIHHHSYIHSSIWMGAGFCFLTCLILIGLYEAARDVEDPFAYEPNDLPLVAVCRRFNESIHAVDQFPRCPGGVRVSNPLTQISDLQQNPGLIVGGVRAVSDAVRRMSQGVAVIERQVSGRLEMDDTVARMPTLLEDEGHSPPLHPSPGPPLAQPHPSSNPSFNPSSNPAPPVPQKLASCTQNPVAAAL